MIEHKESMQRGGNSVATPQLLSGFRSPSPRLRTFNLLSSPSKVMINNPHSFPKSSPEVTDPISSERGFTELSSQLSGLLGQLSEIYTEVGYSETEIEKNERSLFELISHTFDKFLSDSMEYKHKLTEDNTRTTKILRSVLKSINDPSGSRTIPDLYLRNLITKDVQEGTSLLTLKKCLASSMDKVLKDYRERLMKFLQHSQTINLLTLRVDGFPSPEKATIPTLNHTLKILNAFEKHSSTSDIYEILVSESKLLLETDSLNQLSDERFVELTQLSNQLRAEVNKRLKTLRETSQSIINLWNELDIDHKNEYFMISERVLSYADAESNVDELDISSAIITELMKQFEDLKAVKVERQLLIDEYSEKCEKLWHKLREDPHSINQFKQSHQTLTMDSITAYESEYQRLELKKKESLEEFTQEARSQIMELWDQLCFSDEERAKFVEYRSDIYTDGLLTQHEAEIERLTNIYNSYRPILLLVQEFNSLLDDRTNLEESTRDSSRLLQRNSHKILMEEEKTRKRLTRQLPRVVGDLKTKMTEFENEIGPLTFLDQDMLNKLDEEQRLLESKGRRVLSGSMASRAPSPAPSRAASRAPSAAPSRMASRNPSRNPSAAPSRVTSRAPSRLPSRQPSRNPSPIRAKPTPSSRAPTTQGIQKPLRKPLSIINKPVLTSSKSCILPPLNSPTRETNLSITSEMLREKRQLRTPSVLTRSHSTFQPQLPRLAETNGSARKPRPLSPLKTDSRSNLPLLKTRNEKITTSPLKSLSQGHDYQDRENLVPVQVISDQDDGDDDDDDDDENDTYSNWRKEQLKKLNAARHAANNLNWETDTF